MQGKGPSTNDVRSGREDGSTSKADERKIQNRLRDSSVPSLLHYSHSLYPHFRTSYAAIMVLLSVPPIPPRMGVLLHSIVI